MSSNTLKFIQEFSTFPQDMDVEFLPEQFSVPTNDLVVPLEHGKKWTRNWHLYTETLEGFSMHGVSK